MRVGGGGVEETEGGTHRCGGFFDGQRKDVKWKGYRSWRWEALQLQICCADGRADPSLLSRRLDVEFGSRLKVAKRNGDRGPNTERMP